MTATVAAGLAAAHAVAGRAAVNRPALLPGCRLSPARIGRAAIGALHDELAMEPKPGLVSFADSGSHTDMDAATFMRSLFALRHYFGRIAQAGAATAPWPVLESLGMAAEARMLAATGGVNTHRGAIFLLGLLCAGAGAVAARGDALTATAVRHAIALHWGAALQQRARTAGASHGQQAARRHGLRGAGDEAAAGFPVLFDHAWPALRCGQARGLSPRAARLDALFQAMATLDDTNLAHRGGLGGLRHAQREAQAFVADGGASAPGAVARARRLHQAFTARRLSPGGSADVLAAACLLHRLGAAA